MCIKSSVLMLRIFIINLIVISAVQAAEGASDLYDYDLYESEIFDIVTDIVPERETLMHQVRSLEMSSRKSKNNPKPLVPQSPKIDINQLVKNGVTTCYNTYRPNYDQAIARERSHLAGMNLLKSSYAQQIPGIQAKLFAEAIINQINMLAQQLSPNDRQIFWNIAGAEIKQTMNDFCNSHQGSVGDLNSHIDNLINMKKIFG